MRSLPRSDLTWATIEEANEELRLRTQRWNNPMRCQEIAREEFRRMWKRWDEFNRRRWTDRPRFWWLRPTWWGAWRHRKAWTLRYEEGGRISGIGEVEDSERTEI